MTLLICVIALALIFDFINGFHDAANSIATIVATRVLTPVQAVIWAAAFNFIAFFIFSDHSVANTISKTVIAEYITLHVIIAGLLSAICWNLLTWWFGIPSSSSHTLIGGFAGAAIVHAGGAHSIEITKITKIISFIFVAPLIGMIMSVFLSLIVAYKNFFVKTIIIVFVLIMIYFFVPFNIYFQIGIMVFAAIFAVIEGYLYFSKAGSNKYNQFYRKLQLLSSAVFSLGHGGNDAQKVMGIIGAALICNGNMGSMADMPAWVPLSCYIAIGVGTLSGGWKIVKTMGNKITKVNAVEGVCSETAGAFTLFLTEKLGIPVSTTHTITGSIIGVGLTKRISAVRWGVTVNILWAWVLTIPISGILAGLFYYILKFIL